MYTIRKSVFTITSLLLLASCGGGSSPSGNDSTETVTDGSTLPVVDDNVSTPINEPGSGTVTLPSAVAIGDLADSNFYYTMNNSWRLDGPMIGLGAADNSLYRKSLTVTVAEPSDSLSVRAGYLIRDTSRNGTRPGLSNDGPDELSDRGVVVLVIRNVSDSTICFTDLNDVVLLDSNEVELDSISHLPLAGSYGETFVSKRNSCVSTKEDVYVLNGSLKGDFATADSVVIQSFDQGLVAEPAPVADIVAESYAINSDTGELQLNIRNNSTREYSEFLVELIVLDEQGLPLSYDRVADTPRSFPTAVPAGEVGTISFSKYTDRPNTDGNFLGMASTIRVVF